MVTKSVANATAVRKSAGATNTVLFIFLVLGIGTTVISLFLKDKCSDYTDIAKCITENTTFFVLRTFGVVTLLVIGLIKFHQWDSVLVRIEYVLNRRLLTAY